MISTVQNDPGSIKEVVFNPSKLEVVVTPTDPQAKKIKVHYPSDQAQIQFQRLLQAKKVTFDSKGTGSSPWWSILTSLLPFVILLGFWMFLMNRCRAAARR